MAKAGSQRNPTIESLKDRIARDPLSRAFLQLAEEYRKEGRFQEAIEVCLEGLQRHPAYHTARISLGRTYMEAGDMENARRAFAEVLDLQPENHLAAKILAEIQKKMGDPTGAAATYSAILRYYPNDREVANLLDETLRQGSAPVAGPPTAAPSASALKAPPPTPGGGGVPPARPAAPVTPAPAARTASVVPPLPASVAAPGPARVASAAAAPSAPSASILPPQPKGPQERPADPSPDFGPEDFSGAPFTPARDAWSVPETGAPAAWPGPPSRAVEGRSDDDALQTNTLAELYLRQGLVDRAIEVYRGMLSVDPGNQKAARRLSELAPGSTPIREAKVAGKAGGAPRADLGAGPAASRPEVVPARANGDARRETIRRLERWLANVGGSAAKGAPLR